MREIVVDPLGTLWREHGGVRGGLVLGSCCRTKPRSLRDLGHPRWFYRASVVDWEAFFDECLVVSVAGGAEEFARGD